MMNGDGSRRCVGINGGIRDDDAAEDVACSW